MTTLPPETHEAKAPRNGGAPPTSDRSAAAGALVQRIENLCIAQWFFTALALLERRAATTEDGETGP
jgi:hypothetical protein